ncbi:hypothetical protein RhiirC2_728602, partial [Rhizophagus irregularis]
AMHLAHCTEEDWPYLPLSLSWTLPAVYKRVFGGEWLTLSNYRRNLKTVKFIHIF